MNQHQRKFLLDEIEKQYRRELDELRKQRPKAPSLNNYLIAAILDGTAQMKPQDEVARHIRARVRDLGKDESFVSPGREWGRRMDDDDEHREFVNVPVLIMFEPPAQYAEKYRQYEEALQKWQDAMKALDASIAAMRIKVQVGSDKALETLVDQADQLCAMSLTVSSKLLSSKPAKELSPAAA